MADAPAKAPAPTPPSPIDWDVTEFVRNPSGAIHDIHKSHPAAALAARGKEGWRLATPKEAEEYCETHNIDKKGLEGYAAHVKELQKEAEKADAAAAGPAAPVIAEAPEAEAEPKAKK